MARRRADDLLLAGASVKVVAPDPSDELRADSRVAGVWRPYQPGDLEGAYVAVAATDDEEVNRQVAAEAVRLGILVNVVDRPALCTFTMPAVVRRGDLTIAVSTNGRCPSLASLLREDLEARYGPEYAALLDELADLRQSLIGQGREGDAVRAAIARRLRD